MCQTEEHRFLHWYTGCSISPFFLNRYIHEQHENASFIVTCKNDKGIQCEKMTASLLVHRLTVWINKLTVT